MSANAAGDAADAQSQAAQSNLALATRQYDTMQQQISPYLAAGQTGLTAYGDLLGSNGAGAQNQAIGDIKNGAQFQGLMQTGNENILANASATGGLRGSNTSNTLANTSINTLNGLITQRLAGYGQLMGNGLNAVSGSQAAGNAFTGAATNANNQQANAATSQAGALSNAFNSGIGAITQGVNAYSTMGGAANQPTYGTTGAGNPIYFTGT
ncbi:Phage DNA transfer protein [Caballeronia glathei]|nr:hypothetical protein [Caballeronia glathei]CDY76113.1 Phage DNA transfer protein [Caballeronia glathei]